MDFDAVIKVELSYWLVKYIKSTGKSSQDIAKDTGLPIVEVEKAIRGEPVKRKTMESLCDCISRPYEMLRKPPVDDPVFLRFTKSLTDEYQNLRENRNKNDIYGMTKSMSKDFPFEDIERISAWLRYLISNPDSAESRSVVEPIMDMEEQFKTRTNWICRCKNKVRKIRVETFRSSTTTTLARELTTPESSEDMERAEKRVKDSRMGKKK